MKKGNLRRRGGWLGWTIRGALAMAGLVVPLAALHFPYDVDAPLTALELDKARKYYAEAYRESSSENNQLNPKYEARYIQIAKSAAEHARINDADRFIRGSLSVTGPGGSRNRLRPRLLTGCGQELYGAGYFIQREVASIIRNLSLVRLRRCLFPTTASMVRGLSGFWSTCESRAGTARNPACHEEQWRGLPLPCLELHGMGGPRSQRTAILGFRPGWKADQGEHSESIHNPVQGGNSDPEQNRARNRLATRTDAIALSSAGAERQGVLGTGQRRGERFGST